MFPSHYEFLKQGADAARRRLKPSRNFEQNRDTGPGHFQTLSGWSSSRGPHGVVTAGIPEGVSLDCKCFVLY